MVHPGAKLSHRGKVSYSPDDGPIAGGAEVLSGLVRYQDGEVALASIRLRLHIWQTLFLATVCQIHAF